MADYSGPQLGERVIYHSGYTYVSFDTYACIKCGAAIKESGMPRYNSGHQWRDLHDEWHKMEIHLCRSREESK